MNTAYVFLVFHNVTAALACMTEALWAKRGKRNISRRGKEKNKALFELGPESSRAFCEREQR